MMDWFPPFFDGTLREHYLLLFGTASALALVAGGVGAWLGAWLAGRRALRQALLERPEVGVRVSDERLDQLGAAVDLIAVEVERIAEAQRFTARLLADKQTLPLHRKEPGAVTPH